MVEHRLEGTWRSTLHFACHLGLPNTILVTAFRLPDPRIGAHDALTSRAIGLATPLSFPRRRPDSRRPEPPPSAAFQRPPSERRDQIAVAATSTGALPLTGKHTPATVLTAVCR